MPIWETKAIKRQRFVLTLGLLRWQTSKDATFI